MKLLQLPHPQLLGPGSLEVKDTQNMEILASTFFNFHNDDHHAFEMQGLVAEINVRLHINAHLGILH